MNQFLRYTLQSGETFLMVASRCGETEIVKELLMQSEIDVNAVDNVSHKTVHYTPANHANHAIHL